MAAATECLPLKQGHYGRNPIRQETPDHYDDHVSRAVVIFDVCRVLRRTLDSYVVQQSIPGIVDHEVSRLDMSTTGNKPK